MTIKFTENDNPEVAQKDIEFLRDLQNELKSQDNDGTAQPLYWGIMESRKYAVPEGCGDFGEIVHDDGSWNLEEALEFVDSEIENYEETVRDQWENIDRTNLYDVYWFMKYEMGLSNIDYVDFVLRDELSTHTGAFLTKRAAKEYIEKYKYNHSNPRTYAMCAFRNFELEKLLKILRDIEL